MPKDVAAEWNTAEELRRKYRRKFLGVLRLLEALRVQAPGIIAQYLLAGVFSLWAGMFYFRYYHEPGPTSVVHIAVFCFACLCVGVGSAYSLWLVIGLPGRNGVRYLIRKIWVLAGFAFIGLFVAGLALRVAAQL